MSRKGLGGVGEQEHLRVSSGQRARSGYAGLTGVSWKVFWGVEEGWKGYQAKYAIGITSS
jgi:hypothetical protein